MITKENREAWENYTIAHHEELVREAHMLGKGNLDSLVGGKFHPYIAKSSADGFVKDDEREQYFPCK